MMIQRYIGLLPLCVLLMAGISGESPTPASAAATIARQNLSKFSQAQWSALFNTVSGLPLGQRIALWAELAAIDSVYAADPLGEGPQHPPDMDPLNDFTHVDCVTFIEQVYALALSADYQTFPDTLRKIRYSDGQIDYRWRNHYFVSDWLPANSCFIHDVTAEVGAGYLTSMKKTISRGKFFKENGLPKYADLPDEEATKDYIARESAKNIVGKLQTGDIVIFVIDTPGIIAGHVGLIRMKNGAAFVQHASLTAKSVVTVPLLDYLHSLPARFLGIKIARPSEPTLEEPLKATTDNAQ